MTHCFPVQRRQVSAVLLVPFVVGIFLPYLKVSPLPTDLQPLALGSAILIALWYGPEARIPKPLLALWGLVAASLCALLVSDINLNSLRSIANYVSYFTIAVATFVSAASPILRGLRIVDAANLVWCTVGLLQTLYNRELLTFALSGGRTTLDRGVTSLAAEPSFYGTVSYMFLMTYVLQRREKSWWALLCIFQIVFLARTPLGTVMLAVFLIAYVLLNINVRTVFFSAVVIAVSLYVVTSTSWLSGSRLGAVAEQVSQDPTDLIRRDHSTSARFYHIALSLKGAAANGFFPRGYSSWSTYFESEMASNSFHYMSSLYEETPDRIMSAIGAAFFELGIFGLLVPAALLLAIRHHYGSLANRRALTLAAGMMLAMLNSVPLGFPLYGFIVGYCFATHSPEQLSALGHAASVRRSSRPMGTRLAKHI
jgi:hypothetical protein